MNELTILMKPTILTIPQEDDGTDDVDSDPPDDKIHHVHNAKIELNSLAVFAE